MALFGGKTKTADVIRRVGETVFGWMSYGGTSTAMELNNTTALQNSAIRAAVAVISEGVAQTPLNLIQTYKQGDLVRRRSLVDHPMAKLMRKPNSFQTQFEFIEMMVANALLGKGALAIKVKVGNQVRELLPVPHGGWTMEVLANGTTQFQVLMAAGNSITYAQSDVVFIHGLSLDGYTGVAAIEVARYAAAIAAGFEKQILGIASNGGRPSGIIAMQELTDPVRRETFAASWKAKFGVGGEGGVAVLDAGTTFSPISLSAVESQVIDNRKFQIAEIARFFRVQPQMLMDGTAINNDIMRLHVRHTLMPWFVRVEQALARDLLDNAPDLAFDFDERELLRGDHETLGPFLQSMLGNGGTPAIMSVNEARYELGLDPIDEPWAQTPLMGGYEGSNPTTNGDV